MKLFYKVPPERYHEAMDQVKQEFHMHEEVEEQRTTLVLENEETIELVSGSFDPKTDDVARVRVVLHDERLREFFDSV
ncbi:MAG: hypothetical protein ACTSV2_19935, partial [Candidatus Thorarchaeota archaeon]